MEDSKIIVRPPRGKTWHIGPRTANSWFITTKTRPCPICQFYGGCFIDPSGQFLECNGRPEPHPDWVPYP